MSARSRSLSVLALAAFVVAVVVAAGSAAPNRAAEPRRLNTPRSFFGVVPQAQLGDSDYELMGDNGVKTLRAGLYWSGVEPAPPLPLSLPNYDFSKFDATVRGAALNRITVLPYLYGTPTWVAKGPDLNLLCTNDCNLYAPQSTAALQAWQGFAAAAAARYGPNGTFWDEPANQDVPYKPIHTWQIWNEENSKTFYLPKPDPAKYAKVLSAATDGIQSQDPKADIVLGGIFGLPGKNDTTKSIAAADFLHDLLKVKGAKHDFDGFALHPYSAGLNFVKKQVTVARAEMRKSGYPSAELWITETGAASGGQESGLNLGSQKAQAKRVTDTYKLFERNRKAWNVKLVAWFAWQDVSQQSSNCFFCEKAGLVTTSGKAKLSLGAYKRATK